MKHLRESFESPSEELNASPTANEFKFIEVLPVRVRQGGTTYQFGSGFSDVARNSTSAVYRVDAYYKDSFELPK